jgi:heterodisulfide reductase subunit D
MSIIREYNPELILTACPGCFHSLKNLYPQRLGVEQPYQVADISQFLIREVKPRVALGSYCRAVAWHDPCVLGRQLGIYEEPRDILRAIPGLKLVELKSHHEKSKCCGAGLAEVEKTNDLSLQVAVDRLKEAREVGAEELVTSCPACYITLKRAETFSQSETRVRYITELLDEVAAK